ncbi:UspA [Sesbania bispinosa]|nr:UspA [Sesbania bispinosa]
MGRPRIRLHNLCIGHATPRVRACSASSFQSKSSSASIRYANRTEFSSNGDQEKIDNKGGETGNKVMVVVDPSFEAKGALEWALSHTVQSQDTVVLVHVARPNRESSESAGKFNLKAYQLLLDMKSMCELKRPGVVVNVVMLEGEEKGAAIVQEAKQQRVSLLVVGQKKRSILWGLMRRWTRRRRRAGVVEYCIQNSPCMTIAVRRKNKKLGGYLITTKRHKNFWLLA